MWAIARRATAATFGGSLCHLDPSAELVNLAALHDGVLEATSRSGEPADRDGRIGSPAIMTHSLAPGELLTDIELRALAAKRMANAFEEFARRPWRLSPSRSRLPD